MPGLNALYALSLAASISLWFIAIRAPLWLDETVSYFWIKGGFRELISRQGWPTVPAYSFVLWLWTKMLGTGEITLRILSILAMLGAVYLLYRAARELFDTESEKDVAIIAAVVFCLNPIVIFAAIDVRPYALAALAVNASIFILLRLRRNNSNWLAALFGFSAASIVYFHFLFQVILPALAIGFIAVKMNPAGRQSMLRQGAVALGVFAVAYLPVIPGLLYMLHTSGEHVFDQAPKLAELDATVAPGGLFLIFAATILVAAALRRLDVRTGLAGWRILLCASLALAPILILYGVSAETSIHIFVLRYRLVAIPGIALCWAWLVSRIDSRALRLLFCVALVALTAYQYFRDPISRQHGYTWKYALEIAQANARVDNAPVLICSDLPEADHSTMPVGVAVKDSVMFAPLTYYRLSVPVVALPRAFNTDARRIVASFLAQPERRRQRFLAMGFWPSYGTLVFITDSAAATHRVHNLGLFDGITVNEFTVK